MEAVILKGRKEGFELQLADWADFEVIMPQLETLLTQLNHDTATEAVAFVLETGNRLLVDNQVQRIEELFDRFPRFSIKQIHSLVGNVEELRARYQQAMPHLAGGVIRSGQIVEYPGDVIFTGSLHKSATIKATGSVLILGDVSGLIIAGSEGDTQAVIAGDVSHASQIRIADTVEIIEDRKQSGSLLSYINDLHILEHGDIVRLKELRPRLFRKMEEL
ncbi:septum site-determining protein MinC [Lacticaseibacillus saniviri]|uniref:Septum formation inhibitor n=1 Tax=Lacticaseibacillus saniviri JCM 17471 = DSM 24301 TaxID=1293598 RepID=A0A0R2MXM7_9LACO|nr:septum site-determining protein MinC [Lacticaseibacillus saniviri]KRO18392.1 septum formation inhibitor [Lacticaseibacillus saniviri JCM 17471 = DSM 24301]